MFPDVVRPKADIKIALIGKGTYLASLETLFLPLIKGPTLSYFDHIKYEIGPTLAAAFIVA